ncbi:MAG: general stress protein [Cohnella sp.]|nr:general stress protein [Cohnella sp.]
MTENIAIFDNEQRVLDAIRLLREAGAEQDDIRVIVNNREGAPRLSSEGDIRLEELYELQLIRMDDGGGGQLVVPGFQPGGMSQYGSARLEVALVGDPDRNEPSSEELLRDIGIPGDAVSRCAKAIENGRYVVVTDTEVGINAEALLSRAGATEVVGWEDV